MIFDRPLGFCWQRSSFDWNNFNERVLISFWFRSFTPQKWKPRLNPQDRPLRLANGMLYETGDQSKVLVLHKESPIFAFPNEKAFKKELFCFWRIILKLVFLCVRHRLYDIDCVCPKRQLNSIQANLKMRTLICSTLLCLLFVQVLSLDKEKNCKCRIQASKKIVGGLLLPGERDY